MNKTDWLAIKQKNFSATEYAAYKADEEGVEWYFSMFELIFTKLFFTPEQYIDWQDIIKTASMEAGKRDEAFIMNLARINLRCAIEQNFEFITHEDTTLKAGSTPDGFIVNNGKRVAVVETKRTSKEYITDIIKGYTYQVKFQLFTTGLDKGILYIAKENQDTKTLEPFEQQAVYLKDNEREAIKKDVLDFWGKMNFAQKKGVEWVVDKFKDVLTKRDKMLLKFFKGESAMPELIAEFNQYKQYEALLQNKEAISAILEKYLDEQGVQGLLSELEYNGKCSASQIIKKLNINGEYVVNGVKYDVRVKPNKDSVWNIKHIEEITTQAKAIASGEISVGTFKAKGAVRLDVKEVKNKVEL